MKKTLTVKGDVTDWLHYSETALKRMQFTNIEADAIFHQLSGEHEKFGNISIEFTSLDNGAVRLSINTDQPETIDYFKRAVSKILHNTKGPSAEPSPHAPSANDYESPKKQKRKNPVAKVLLIILGLLVALILAFSIAYGLLYGKSPTAPKSEYYLNETASVDKVDVTLTKYNESAGNEFLYPTDGNVFLLCEFEIVNNSSSDLNISSLASFTSYCDGYAVNLDLSALSSDGNVKSLDGTIAPGKKLSGYLAYQVPQNWQELEVNFKPNAWNDKSIKFIASK